MKFCRDCKHARPGWNRITFPFNRYRFARCVAEPPRETGRVVFAVTGKPDDAPFCTIAREFGECGMAATLFEAKR